MSLLVFIIVGSDFDFFWKTTECSKLEIEVQMVKLSILKEILVNNSGKFQNKGEMTDKQINLLINLPAFSPIFDSLFISMYSCYSSTEGAILITS